MEKGTSLCQAGEPEPRGLWSGATNCNPRAIGLGS